MRLLLLILLLPLITFTQINDLDSILLIKINDYRLLNDLKKVCIDTNLKEVCKKHNRYIIDKKEFGHYEKTVGFENPSKRFLSVYKKRPLELGEICAFLPKNIDTINISYKEKLCESILLGWINSPEHKEILLSNYDYISLSIDYEIYQIKNSKFNIKIYSTCLFYK